MCTIDKKKLRKYKNKFADFKNKLEDLYVNFIEELDYDDDVTLYIYDEKNKTLHNYDDIVMNNQIFNDNRIHNDNPMYNDNRIYNDNPMYNDSYDDVDPLIKKNN
ncbi:putative orfan [Tupanvirus soda lake]|uniref:Orfan n=2 Tax=Tupanvirus TaxID=2094720 RepID=A0AC62ADF1_9VIRU|nr:putative orfan [Tupanvirus soda lake]QKU35742.1 putative orfan [Tupanvirus soda lake]